KAAADAGDALDRALVHHRSADPGDVGRAVLDASAHTGAGGTAAAALAAGAQGRAWTAPGHRLCVSRGPFQSVVPAGEEAQANLVVGVVADQEPESVRGGGKGGRKIEREDLGSAKRRCALADADRDGDHFPGRIHHVKLAAAGGPETLEHA